MQRHSQSYKTDTSLNAVSSTMEAQVFGNVSTTFSWIPNPTTRGSSNILQGCLITIGLCVWTAVHLNIPDEKQPTLCGFQHQTWRKVGWIFIGLFAPELLIYAAWDQRRIAKLYAFKYNNAFSLTPPKFKLIRWLRKFGSKQGDVESNDLRNTDSAEPWSLQHGFYAAMGGFVLDTTSNKTAERYSLPQTRVFLNLTKFMKLLDSPAIISGIRVTAAEISDKSKANGLSKSLVCLQAAWFCMQCVARLNQHLPLTLLEINTAAHSLAALSVYLLWWHKPLDIERSTSLFIQDSEEGIRSWVHTMGYACFACLRRDNISPPEGKGDQDTIEESQSLNPGAETTIQHCSVIVKGPAGSQRRVSGHLIKDTTGESGTWWPDNKSASGSSHLQHGDVYQLLDAVHTHSGWVIRSGTAWHSSGRKEGYFRSKNFPARETSTRQVRVVFVLLTFIYGGLHVLAWNSQFPSDTQQLLWRVSSSIVAGGGLLILVLHRVDILEDVFVLCGRLWNLVCGTPAAEDFGFIGYLLNKALVFLCLVAYCLARVYLVADCFIQLFHLQSGAFFRQPRWLAYVPHFG